MTDTDRPKPGWIASAEFDLAELRRRRDAVLRLSVRWGERYDELGREIERKQAELDELIALEAKPF